MVLIGVLSVQWHTVKGEAMRTLNLQHPITRQKDDKIYMWKEEGTYTRRMNTVVAWIDDQSVVGAEEQWPRKVSVVEQPAQVRIVQQHRIGQ